MSMQTIDPRMTDADRLARNVKKLNLELSDNEKKLLGIQHDIEETNKEKQQAVEEAEEATKYYEDLKVVLE